jgi:hypothetical protein
MKFKRTIKKGSSDFKTIIEDNGYFVDKTMLIKEFFENGNYIMLMPRPKRFGKTLNLSMIEHFFDIQKTDSAKLFTEFEITNEIGFCKKHQNKYPVINISLKSVKETDWEQCLNRFKILVSNLYKTFRFLLQSDKLEKEDKLFFENIISKTTDLSELKESLVNLGKYLKKHFNQKVIILVDEYDAPIISAFQYTPSPIKNYKSLELTYYQKAINFMQSFLGEAFKGNEDSLKKGLLTGVMRIGKESIFSEWNNFEVYGITSTYFADKFGFTQEETKKILHYFNLQDDINDISKWYDGYKFGNITQIYNPWSIVSYILNKNDGYKPYWVNTGSDILIRDRILEPDIDKTYKTLQKLISGELITKDIEENFIFADFETDRDLLWTLLTYSGYLTQVNKVKLETYELKIPNFEIEGIFKKIIIKWLTNKINFRKDLLISTSFNLINNQIKEFEIGFKQIIGDTLSYFDIAPIKDSQNKEIFIDKEQFFHVYTLGLLAILSDDYIISSNREGGEGRYDIVLIPRNIKHNGIIIEIKQIENQQETEKNKVFIDRINNKINEALEQIERKKYYKTLLAHRIELDKIIRVPIVFAGKEPYITKLPN